MKKEENNNILEKDYFNDLNKIKDTIKQNQNKAMIYVNSQMILTYYEIGTIINKRKTWGSKFIQNLANDLKEYGKGYSVQNLKYMSQFANEFTKNEISQQPVGQIPWGTLMNVILPKSKSHYEMLFYINATHKNGWSRSMVLNQIEMKTYERSLIESNTTSIVKSDNLTNELFKDTYVFNFLKTDGDNDTIGLLLCKDADKYVAETTLKKSLMKLGISKYKLIEELPEYLERKLNSK